MIGVFDSGLGGLTVLRHLRCRLPDADLLYFGDTGHLPYGNRSPTLIRRYTDGAFRFFSAEGVSALLVACGTVSTVALEALRGEVSFPVEGIAAPAVRLCADSGYSRIAVLGTAATVGSRVYEDRLREVLPGASVLPLACPLFVALVENGVTERSDPALQSLVRRTLTPCFSFRPDAILLACTHFPVLSGVIGDLFPGVDLIDCGAEAVRRFPSVPGREGQGRTRFCVSDSPERFREAARHIFAIPPDVPIEIHKTEEY